MQPNPCGESGNGRYCCKSILTIPARNIDSKSSAIRKHSFKSARVPISGQYRQSTYRIGVERGPGHGPHARPRCRHLRNQAGRRLWARYEALKGHADALYVAGDPLLNAHRVGLNILAVGARLPTMYIQREFVEAGGLISYGPNFQDLFRRAAGYVDKILRGAKPADIPVEQPTKFDFVINLTTAKALGLTVPLTLLARTDEVIE